ncbi:MAG: hypothetical protein E6Q97_31940 [Desulfurellales bacterium]|nr:MAG: hypothetical protein E6Q97_31940 [Desulfurellales bacterium]
MTEQPIQQEAEAHPAPEVPPLLKRPPPLKMSISEQATFLGLFVNKFRMRDGSWAGELMTRVTQEDMRRFETIWQTMMIMEVHGADRLIHDKISRERRAALHKK